MGSRPNRGKCIGDWLVSPGVEVGFCWRMDRGGMDRKGGYGSQNHPSSPLPANSTFVFFTRNREVRALRAWVGMERGVGRDGGRREMGDGKKGGGEEMIRLEGRRLKSEYRMFFVLCTNPGPFPRKRYQLSDRSAKSQSRRSPGRNPPSTCHRRAQRGSWKAPIGSQRSPSPRRCLRPRPRPPPLL